jgi:pyruvate dehydrogenase E1 component
MLVQPKLTREQSAFLSRTPAQPTSELLATLDTIQQRVLWLATLIIHHANNVRPNPDGSKVGGHQASSASMVSIMTVLYFHFLKAGDRVSVKPHASPVFHAVQYLMGQLPQRYLTTLRAYGGLQAYPSRTKDPDRVDFSTGSVGLGAVAPAFAALAQRYIDAHFGSGPARRFIALVGDAELDEGNVWEAILDPALDGLDNLLWIVDLNRQSLDRVVPGIRATHLKRLFAESGWRVLEAKYGRKLQALFDRPGGSALRLRIDEMSNEEYQALIRLSGAELRPRLIRTNGVDSAEIASSIRNVPDDALPAVLANLGCHDLEELLDVLAQADAEPRKPTIIFAYTIKGWGLPIAGHPLNHSMLLTDEQIDALREHMGIAVGQEWAAFDPNSAAGQLCAAAAERLFPSAEPVPDLLDPAAIPEEIAIPTQGTASTQDAFGRILVRLADVPPLRERIVTTAPDVSVSTNLAGWINKTGVFTPQEEPDYETEAYRLMKWKRGPGGRHIELGISEMNLFTLLGMFGLSAELCAQQLIPIGTVYDPFVCRGLDALIYGLYCGAKFIFAGTPSGVTLSPEGGAHQSSVTPSLGMELPNLDYYEPCFSQELSWIMVEALRQCCDRVHGRPTYLRLSTKPIDQLLLTPTLKRLGAATLRQQVLAGAYRLLDWRDSGMAAGAPLVQIAVTGTMVPEAIEAATYLQREGVAVNVLNLTSPRRLFEAWQATRQNQRDGGAGMPLQWIIPAEERPAPIITVHDAAPNALAWLGSVYGAPVTALGVNNFGQSGARADLYHAFGIDTEAIITAAFEAIDEVYFS